MFDKIYKKVLKIINQLRLVNIKIRGAKIGKNVKVFGRFTVINPKNLTIGDNSTINEGVHINCREKVFIGKYVRISTNVQIHTGKLDLSTNPRIHTQKPIYIDENVWITSGVVISAGVKIGKNSVIGANSVIINDIEADYFYAGNPCKKIRPLKVVN